MRLRRSVRIAFVVALIGFLPGLWGMGANAEEPTQYGWWYRGNTLLVQLPQPPGIPSDALYVAKDLHPEEPLAIAALLYLAESGPGATLELSVADGTIPPEARIRACPTTQSWSSGGGQMWESRPIGFCDEVEVLGEILGEGTSVVFRLGAEFEVFPEFWNIVISPTGNVPFSVTFDRPDSGSFSVDPDPGEFEDGGSGGEFDFEDFATDGSFSFPGATDLGDIGPAEDFGTMDEPAEAPVAAPAETRPVRPRAAREAPDDTKARIIALVVLAALGAGVWFLSRQQVRPVAAIGGRTIDTVEDEPVPEDQGPVGGIGRFSRPRAAGPRRLV